MFVDVFTLLRRAEKLPRGLDPNDSGDHRDFEAVIAVAQEVLHRFGIESAGDLLGRSDGEVSAGDLDEIATLELILEVSAFRFSAFQDGIGMAECVCKCLVRQAMESGCGIGMRSLRYDLPPGSG
jgi:hypothetical protein